MIASVPPEAVVSLAPAMLRAAAAAWMATACTPIAGWMRLMLALAAGWIAAPLAIDRPVTGLAWWHWVPTEALAGLCIGGIAAISVEALRLAGRVVSEQMGMSMAAPADSSELESGGPVESLMAWSATLAFVSVGGLDAVVLASVRSGAAEAGPSLAGRAASVLDAAFEVGTRACLPVLAISLAGTVIGGVVIRAAPRMVSLGSGFGARAAVGMGMLAASAGGAWMAQQDLFRRSLGLLGPGGAW